MIAINSDALIVILLDFNVYSNLVLRPMKSPWFNDNKIKEKAVLQLFEEEEEIIELVDVNQGNPDHINVDKNQEQYEKQCEEDSNDDFITSVGNYTDCKNLLIEIAKNINIDPILTVNQYTRWMISGINYVDILNSFYPNEISTFWHEMLNNSDFKELAHIARYLLTAVAGEV